MSAHPPSTLQPPSTREISLRHLYFTGGSDYWDLKIRGDKAPKWPAHVPPHEAVARLEAAIMAAITAESEVLSRESEIRQQA